MQSLTLRLRRNELAPLRHPSERRASSSGSANCQPMQLSTFLIQILNGVQYGMLLFLIASGLTLTFGIMGIINLAHGAFFMIGAYLVFQFTRHMGWPLPARLCLGDRLRGGARSRW